MKVWLTYLFCLMVVPLSIAQVIKSQSAGNASAITSSNGDIKHSAYLGAAVSQGVGNNNQAGFYFANVDYRPAHQASSVLFSGLTPNSLTLIWINGNGTRRVVICKAGSAVDAMPISKTFYGADSFFGNGSQISPNNFVVYEGTGNIVTVTNLSPSIIYHFKIFEYNGRYETSPGVFNNANIEYQTEGATGNPSSRITLASPPITAATAISFSNVTKNQTTISWTNGNGNKRLVVAKQENVINAFPVNGLPYLANSAFSTGDNLGSSNFVVFDGATNQATVSNLLPNTVYHYQIFEYTGSGVDNNYLLASAPTASKLTLTDEPVATDETAVAQTSYNANWQQVAGATNYHIDVSTDAGFASNVNTFQSTALTRAISGLIPGIVYYYRVRAENTTGQSANSNVIELLTVPATPTELPSTDIFTNKFTANWSASASAVKYFVDVATDAGFTQFVSNAFQNREVVTNSLEVTGLSAGTEYFIRVRAMNASGTSPNAPSGYKQITITDAPEALDASNEQKNSFKAKWNVVKGATHYELTVINVTTNVVVNSPDNLFNHPTTEEIVTGLTPATKYKYSVRGKNAGGFSAKSNEKQVITLKDDGTVLNPPNVSVSPQSSLSTAVAQVSGDEPPFQLTFKHRMITGSKFTAEANAVLNSTGNSNQTINSLWSDELGIEYYFVLRDAANRYDSTDVAYAYKSFSSQSIPGFSGFDATAESYKMFSIPAKLDNKAIQTIFQPVLSQFEGYNRELWRMFHYPGGVNQEYLEFETDLFDIEQGKGYWFNARENPAPLSITAGVIEANQKNPFDKLVLKQGWNQIGNPYPFNVEWAKVKAANPAAELKKLWLFNKKYESKDVLPAWEGAFVFSGKGGEVKFPVTSKTTQSGRTSNNNFPTKPDEGIWFLPLELSHQNLNHIGAIGMHPEASNSMDKFDEPTLPRFIHYLEMKTRHEDSFAKNFSEDIVMSADHYSWTFTVNSNINIGEGISELSWETMDWQGSKSSLMLLDVSQQILVDMRTVQKYSFSFESGKQFKILFDKEGLYNPGLTRLGEAYPNPFINLTTVPVLVEEKGEVIKLEFYDMLGKRLTSIEKKFLSPGQYQMEWDGKTFTGEPAPQGVLLYRILKNNGEKTSVKRLIKIN
jgi:Fibronectin type III domain